VVGAAIMEFTQGELSVNRMLKQW